MSFSTKRIEDMLWSTRPTAATYGIGNAFFRDLGGDGVIAYSNGTKWVVPKFNLISGGVPVYLPSSGTIGNNGSLTLTTALPLIYPNVYLYFPVDTIAAGVAAGLYYCQMSSTTVGTIFNNTYTTGVPSIPASPTAFVTTGPGVYVQTTGANITLVNATILGGSMGINGAFKAHFRYNYLNSAGTKTIGLYHDSSIVFGTTATTSASIDVLSKATNAGIENSQYVNNTGLLNAVSSIVPTINSIDTSANSILKSIGQLAVATDFVGVTQYLFEQYPRF